MLLVVGVMHLSMKWTAYGEPGNTKINDPNASAVIAMSLLAIHVELALISVWHRKIEL